MIAAVTAARGSGREANRKSCGIKKAGGGRLQPHSKSHQPVLRPHKHTQQSSALFPLYLEHCPICIPPTGRCFKTLHWGFHRQPKEGRERVGEMTLSGSGSGSTTTSTLLLVPKHHVGFLGAEAKALQLSGPTFPSSDEAASCTCLAMCVTVAVKCGACTMSWKDEHASTFWESLLS